ncbi:uncharacterized protein HHUB_1936 [Halobacterium hubeiense]|uniref:Uncharacterized protein n=1 Tax=Halobacterium hubeiense TaxID=1407499 RepID=A0A0U5H3Y9_9EURY|nr:hypothetical protein [Halobacterium hubeiense]CQH53195.1 uncharacterized protein HHUB_1936 [Halobacterium hubeiense]
MSGDARRSGGAPATGGRREGATLVLGDADHDAACRRLAGDSPDSAYRIRATTDAAGGRCCADVADLYDTGVYDDLALSEAGVVVSDTIANLDAAAGRLVVCVDGLPRPTDESGRRQLLQFLHAVTHRVADADGRCHVHLAADADDDLAAVVEPLFETVVDASD